MAAKRNEVTTTKDDFIPETTGPDTPGADPTEVNFGVDFDVDQEYKPTPLIPGGTYSANIIETGFDSENNVISVTYCLEGNGGMMSDGETPVDGVTVVKKLWLPKPGDETELTSSGKQTKRQAKINMLKDYLDAQKLGVSTAAQISEALANKDWLGIHATLKIGIREYEGRTFNEITKVTG